MRTAAPWWVGAQVSALARFVAVMVARGCASCLSRQHVQWGAAPGCECELVHVGCKRRAGGAGGQGTCIVAAEAET